MPKDAIDVVHDLHGDHNDHLADDHHVADDDNWHHLNGYYHRVHNYDTDPKRDARSLRGSGADRRSVRLASDIR